MKNKGVLLANLGSPSSLRTRDVKKYLREFLSDKYVMDIPAPLRWLLVNWVIVPLRAQKSRNLYRKIWTPGGSPLILNTEKLKNKIQQRLNYPVEVGMRYGKPDLHSSVQRLYAKGCEEIIVMHSYPQYSMSTTKTLVNALEEIRDRYYPDMKFKVVRPYYSDTRWESAVIEQASYLLQETWDHVLFSYHGIPVRHLTKTDPYGHCLSSEHCCAEPSRSEDYCYKRQCEQSTKQLAKRLKLREADYSHCYQSRFGKNWLSPHTEEILAELAEQGKKKVLVFTPAFTTDCLETLEEIGVRGREVFESHGGEKLGLVPCLNDSDPWVDTVCSLIEECE